MTLSTEAAIAIIVASFALIGTLWNGRGVNALQTIINELIEDIKRRKEREKAFEARCARYLKRIAYLMSGIQVLLHQMKLAELKPCWEPDEWDQDEEEPEQPAST
jgi:hypothetical protein